MWYADETGFYFHTGSMKPIYQQLKNNPKVEVCYWKPDLETGGTGTMMRVAGEVEFLDDVALRARLLEERPWLKDIGIASAEYTRLVIFRIAHGEAYFWTMAENMHETEIPRVKF
jgi:uncharacterized pyridoxamine 5'-phosphate oxidase family protein